VLAIAASLMIGLNPGDPGRRRVHPRRLHCTLARSLASLL